MKFVTLNTNASLYFFLLFISRYADISKIQEPEKQKVLKYYVTLCPLMIKQVHSIQAL